MKITTKAELINHIAKHLSMEKDVPLFCAYSLGSKSYVTDTTISKNSIIIIGEKITRGMTPYEDFGDFLYVDGKSEGSLRDRNIPENTYNEHYWFTTREEAEAHIRPKDFVVGQYYEWSIWNKQRPAGQGGTMECIGVGTHEGVFRQRDGRLCIITKRHLEYGDFLLVK